MNFAASFLPLCILSLHSVASSLYFSVILLSFSSTEPGDLICVFDYCHYTAMDSTVTPLASSIWLVLCSLLTCFCEKIVETAKKLLTKIKDGGNAVIFATRTIEPDILKQSLDIFNNWFTWFVGLIVTLKLTSTGEAFFSENYSVLVALFLLKFLSFLTVFLATLSEMHKRNIVPLLLMLLFESGASLLVVEMISKTVLWISVTSWLCVFVLFGFCCNQEFKELILKIKRWLLNQNQESPSLPTATEAPTAEDRV